MGEEIRVIEYHMMKKERYFPLTVASGLCIRCLTYPSMLIKTRLQIQSCDSVYSGTLDAFCKITRSEGIVGLYRGFWVSTLQLLPNIMYFSTYEGMRHWLSRSLGVENHQVKMAVGGFTATVVAQTALVPIEIVMQHLMLMGNASASKASGISTQDSKPSGLGRYAVSSKDSGKILGPLNSVIRGMYRDGGLRGFYQGFWAAVACHGPYNALFWLCFDQCTVVISSVLPDSTPRLAVMSVTAPLGGMVAAYITNPLDVIRARIQVDGMKTKETISTLWKEEGIKFLTKGVSARVLALGTHSMFTFVGYETIKRWSVLEEYKDSIRW